MDEQIALARQAARKLGIPNSESKPLYRVGRTRTSARSGPTWSGLGRGCGKADADQYEAICEFFGWTRGVGDVLVRPSSGHCYRQGGSEVLSHRH